MPLEVYTQEQIRGLAAVCRTGRTSDKVRAPEDRQLVYHRLIKGVVADTLARAYPLTKALLESGECAPEDTWENLVNRFLNSGSLINPELWQMPRGLVEFARAEKLGERLNIPFLDDLLLFEWTEIEVYMMKDCEVVASTEENGADNEGASSSSLDQGSTAKRSTFTLNPHHKILTLSYPVFLQGTFEERSRPGEYTLAVCRDPHDFSVQFVHLSLVAVLALDILKTQQTEECLLRKLYITLLRGGVVTELPYKSYLHSTLLVIRELEKATLIWRNR